MTLQEVSERIAFIQSIKKDSDAAHTHEDSLYFEVLSAIAQGIAENPQAMAALAITTKGIEFHRWCS